MNLQDKIKKIIPYVSEDFIRFPLAIEGKYIPFLYFWQKCKNSDDAQMLKKRMELANKGTGYSIEIEDVKHGLARCFIYPQFTEKNHSYEYAKKDWSIEEMMDILIKFME